MECLENRTIFQGPEDTGKCPNDVVCMLELTVVLAVTALVLSGNVLSLIVMWSTPSLRNCHGYLVMFLAASDVKLGVVGVFSIYPAASFPEICWPHGDTACAVTAFLYTVAMFTSLFALTLLSLERYIAVVFPFQYSQIVTKKTTLLAIITGWFVIIGSSTFAILTGGVGHGYIPDMYICTMDFIHMPVFAIVIMFSFALPCVLIIVVTSCIVRDKLVRNSRQRGLMNATTSTVSDRSEKTGSDGQTHVYHHISHLDAVIRPECSEFLGAGSVTIPQPVVFIASWVVISNSFLNTLIYFAMNSTFRQAAENFAWSLVPNACLNMEAMIFKKCCTCLARKRNVDVTGNIFKKCCACLVRKRNVNVTGDINLAFSNSAANVDLTHGVELQVVTSKSHQDGNE